MLKLALTAVVVLAAFTAHAKTATELFESVSGSLVVVHAKDRQGKPQSQGSGVVIAPGEVVTNCHVLEKSTTFAVKHHNRERPATLKHNDPDRDVCSLTVDGLDAPIAPLGSTKPLKVGHKVYAIGAPKGLALTLSEGIISSLRELEGGRYLQITTPISPGSSGGGLFDEDGRLIGLPTFYLAEGQQLNFAVPVEWIKELPKRQMARQKAGPSSVAWLNKALELQEKQDWNGLLRHTQAWTRARPGEAGAWFGLGIAYGKSGQTAQAIDAFQQTLRIDPEFADAWYNLGVANDKSGQTAQAIEALQQALRIDPEQAKAWYGLGVAHGDTGQTAQAIEAYQQALRIKPEDAAAWYNLGNTYLKAGQTAQAIEAYQQALRIDPEDAAAWYNQGNAYDEAGQPAKAIEAYQQALRIDPEKAKAWYNLGNAYVKFGQTAKAIEALQQALRIDPEYAAAWFNLGIAYKIAGQNGKVMEVYRRLKVLDPQRADRFFSKIVLP